MNYSAIYCIKRTYIAKISSIRFYNVSPFLCVLKWFLHSIQKNINRQESVKFVCQQKIIVDSKKQTKHKKKVFGCV